MGHVTFILGKWIHLGCNTTIPAPRKIYGPVTSELHAGHFSRFRDGFRCESDSYSTKDHVTQLLGYELIKVRTGVNDCVYTRVQFIRGKIVAIVVYREFFMCHPTHELTPKMENEKKILTEENPRDSV